MRLAVFKKYADRKKRRKWDISPPVQRRINYINLY